MSSDFSVLTSIIIPCFNRAQFIQEAIDSSIAQGAGTEVIVVDDGSTDGSWEIISRFKDIVAIRIENSGPSAARNAGVAAARAKYIKFLDSDDRLPAEAINQLVRFASGLRTKQIAFGDAVLIEEQSQPTTGLTYGLADLAEGPIARSHLFSSVLSAELPLFPTEVLRSIGGFDPDLKLSEDYELAARLAARGYEFVHLSKVVCEVREHQGIRLSRGYGVKGFRAQHLAFETAWTELANAETALSREERAKLSGMIWSLGRAASRERHKAEAGALFALANRIAPGDAHVGPMLLKLAYRLASPYSAERLLEAGKSLRLFLRPTR